MNKVIIYLAGQPMMTEATDDELVAFRDMLSRSAYVSWSIAIVGDEEYYKEVADRSLRVEAGVKRLAKRKWFQF